MSAARPDARHYHAPQALTIQGTAENDDDRMQQHKVLQQGYGSCLGDFWASVGDCSSLSLYSVCGSVHEIWTCTGV